MPKKTPILQLEREKPNFNPGKSAKNQTSQLDKDGKRVKNLNESHACLLV